MARPKNHSLPAFWERQGLIWNLPNVAPSLRLTLLAISYHAGDSIEAWPSQATLAAEVGVSDRQIRTLINQLQDLGWISVRRASPNRYRLNWNAISASVRKLKPEPEFRIEQKPIRNSATPKRNWRSGESGIPVPTNTQEHSKEHPSCNGASSKRVSGSVSWSISPGEFESVETGLVRFDDAVECGLVQTSDKLRFMTLWVYTGRQYARQDAGRIRSPGSFLTNALRNKSWNGSDGDEELAQRAIQNPKRRQSTITPATELACALTADLAVGGNHYE